MDIIRKTLSWIAIISIFALIIWSAFKGIQWIRKLDSGVIAAIVTAGVGFIGLLYSQWYSKSREIAEGHRANKIKVYDLYFDIVQHFMDSAKQNDINDADLPEDIANKFKDLNRGMIVWASPGVIRAWIAFKIFAKENKGSNQLMYYVDDVLQAIRKDLGNSNFGLIRGDVVKLYLSNPNELKK